MEGSVLESGRVGEPRTNCSPLFTGCATEEGVGIPWCRVMLPHDSTQVFSECALPILLRLASGSSWWLDYRRSVQCLVRKTESICESLGVFERVVDIRTGAK